MSSEWKEEDATSTKEAQRRCGASRPSPGGAGDSGDGAGGSARAQEGGTPEPDALDMPSAQRVEIGLFCPFARRA